MRVLTTTVSTYSVNVPRAESDCQVVWEKKPTPEEEQKAKSLQLPPTFFCGLSTTDSDTDTDKAEDFETEVRKAQQELVTDRKGCPVCKKPVVQMNSPEMLKTVFRFLKTNMS